MDNKFDNFSLKTSFEQLKKNSLKSSQWLKELKELRAQAKAEDNLPIWIEISNLYIDFGRQNSKIKESLIVLNEVLEAIDLPIWKISDTNYLQLKGTTLLKAGSLYNELKIPNKAWDYLDKAEQIARSIEDSFLLVRIFMSKENSLNIQGDFKKLCEFQLKNINHYEQLVEEYPEKIDFLILGYVHLAFSHANFKEEKKQYVYIEKAYNLINSNVSINIRSYTTSAFILLLIDKKTIEENDLLKVQNLIQELNKIDKTRLAQQNISLYLLAQGYAQTANKNYQTAKETLKQVTENKAYSQNCIYALKKLVEIYYIEKDLEGIQNCFKLQQEILNHDYKNLKTADMVKQEALHEVKQLKIEANYNQKLLKAEIKLRKKIEDKQEKILNLNKELDFFTGMMAHDLKAPLKTIESFLRLIYKRNQKNLEEKDRNFFKFIFEASDQMTILVDKLLSHAKMGGIGITLEPIDLQKQLLIVKSNLQAEINEKMALIKITTPLPQVMGEPNYIKVLFQNLFSNAIKFTPKDRNPSIHVFSEENEKHFCIFVKDNGIGIPQDLLNKVTEPFYRVHNQTKYKGAGLGLATCQKIMNIHKGSLSIESEEGKGSTFLLKFPKKKSDNLK